MSAVFGKEGYRFVEINVVKTILGGIVLLPISLMLNFPIEQLVTQSGNIFLIILLLIFFRLIGSLIIEIVQELILLPILQRRFSSAIEKEGYGDRDELVFFPPHKMWKDPLFKNAREEIVILVSIFSSLIILWTTFNIAHFIPLSFNVFTFKESFSDQNVNETYKMLTLDLKRLVLGINILFVILTIPIIILLYRAVFAPYTNKKSKDVYRWKNKEISRYILFLLPFSCPILISLLSKYIIGQNQNRTAIILYLLLIPACIITYILCVLVVMYIIQHFSQGEIVERITKEEKTFNQSFISYYSMYYTFLNFKEKNIKLESQLYLISAIHAFNLLSSSYSDDHPEKVFLEENKEEDKKINKLLNYTIATKLFKVIIENIAKNNFETAATFFLSQFEEAATETVSKSKNLDLIIYIFEESYKWEPERLFLMLRTVNARVSRGRDPNFLEKVKKRVADELTDIKITSEKFLEGVDKLLDDNNSSVNNVKAGILKCVMLVAEKSVDEMKLFVCVDFWKKFVKEENL